MAEEAPCSETVAHDDICPICHLLLYEPVRTQCNHVLCAACMTQWAESSATTHITPSNLDLDLTDFDPNYDPASDLSTLEANCPMCRTSTAASLDAELKQTLEARYPVTYAERRTEEEAARGDQSGGNGIEGMTILIGNRHRLIRTSRADAANKHDWTFFVRFSRPELIQEVSVDLHPTFRPPRLVLTQPPFEIRRLGWGWFTIEARILLKEPYSWITHGADQRARTQMLMLEWTLDFEGDGQQARVRARIKKIDGDPMDVDERPRPVYWPHVDDENDEDDEDYVE
ncbi:uncharacterized protein BDR25DRAFT_219293 [Lindgomyces ingoldianus]|uniref:Uncharacterized protein n=1 Tax=Lindgomyces ingoldianus TaxID=673940 RepID=A0ACB6R0E3_9PLEO|nr:uncharacterized protein BDR25DRAFT_219293 [Lindgomyces ingoldianus]KAF2472789.1 hypothetical protein BDR25DRAFT_219293 [Lindgomyces ingoldianus]